MPEIVSTSCGSTVPMNAQMSSTTTASAARMPTMRPTSAARLSVTPRFFRSLPSPPSTARTMGLSRYANAKP